MNKFHIRRAAVVGSGTMGVGIAALLAGVGIPVTLLDVAPDALTPDEEKRGLTLERPAVRNRIVNAGLERVKKSRPPALFLPGDVELIATGNLIDDFDRLGEADWVVEAIVENLDVKRDFFARLEKVLKPGSIVSSNTSGLPIHQLAEGRSAEFRRCFLGTHFFNPPRYLRLLEIIPTDGADPALVEFMRGFSERVLGKGVVLCKDTPNFIGNRIGLATIGFRLWYALEHGYSVEEVDAIAGPHLGYPKTGVFRLLDLTGIDVTAHVEKNFRQALPDELTWNRGKAGAVIQQMVAKGWLGNKTGMGFYKEVRGLDGQRDFWPLDLEIMEHAPPRKPRFDSIGVTRKIADLGERLKAMLALSDRAAHYAWHDLAFQFAYSSSKIPEISDDLSSMDNAMKWGYAHDLGPFEKWDALGVAGTVARMEADGYPPANWVKDMLAAGNTAFYRREDGRLMQFSPQAKAYVPVREDVRAISIAALLEYHSKANTYTPGVVEMSWTALDRLERDFDALVIGNQGALFCGGANLDPQLFMASDEPPAAVVDRLARDFQSLVQAIRFAARPIVAAPFDRTLGGGTETCLAAHRIVAAVELYMGLVEVGVGLIPAGGGCKELLRRLMNPVMQTEGSDPLPVMQRVFTQIGLARVSGSAMEACEMGFLATSDRIAMNRAHLLGEAKREALHMAQSGFRPARPEKIYAAGRDVLAAIHLQLFQMREGNMLSDHDVLIAKKLAWVLCGGDLSAPAWVDEQTILDLEREAFVSLIQEPKTVERIMHMLTTGRPLRN